MEYGHWKIKEEMPPDSIGFIYLITNHAHNKKYIGKKLLKFKKTKAPLKGRVNKRRSNVESDWKTYTGSCKRLNEDIKQEGIGNFSFEILVWKKNKPELNYEEMKQIIQANALFQKDYYNEYVGGRVRIRKD